MEVEDVECFSPFFVCFIFQSPVFFFQLNSSPFLGGIYKIANHGPCAKMDPIHPYPTLLHDCLFVSGVEKYANAVHDSIFHPLLVGGKFACAATFEAAVRDFQKFNPSYHPWDWCIYLHLP